MDEAKISNELKILARIMLVVIVILITANELSKVDNSGNTLIMVAIATFVLIKACSILVCDQLEAKYILSSAFAGLVAFMFTIASWPIWVTYIAVFICVFTEVKYFLSKWTINVRPH